MLTDISFIMTSKGEKPSTDTLTINSSPCGYSTNLVGDSKGIVMHLGYRQDLSHLIRPNNDQLQQQQEAGVERVDSTDADVYRSLSVCRLYQYCTQIILNGHHCTVTTPSGCNGWHGGQSCTHCGGTCRDGLIVTQRCAS